jgi:glycine/D-amino acid oxidase-like deaminating enzyme
MIRADVAVVGTGIAGLVFALRMARHGSVAVVTKKERPESSTNYAQGGIAAVFSDDDSYELHREDTLIAGAGLCHRDAVEVLVREGPARVRELIEIGVRFSREDGALSLGREGGHSRRRIVRAADLTGREVERALLSAVAADPNIEIFENHVAIDLLIAPSGGSAAPRCVGVRALDAAAGERVSVRARGATRHRRMRHGLPPYDQPGDRDRRRDRDVVPRRCARREHGVRSVPPDRAVPRGRAQLPDLGGGARRGRGARSAGRCFVHGALPSARLARAARRGRARDRP